MRQFIFLLLLCSVVVPDSSWARPSYAARNRLVSCTTCHVSSSGGGPRNIYGKVFGSRELSPGLYSNQDLFSADIRAVAFYPTKETSQKRNGLGLMTAIGSANVLVSQSDQDASELRAVAAYNFGGFGTGIRDTYLRWTTVSNGGLVPQHILFGRFNAPFGLLTDEHRTYVRLQTQTGLNDYEMGAMVSGEPHHDIHIDLALTSGFQAGGSFQNGDLTYAFIGNLRWLTFGLPVFLGSSLSIHRTLNNQPNAMAWSVYNVVGFDEITDLFLKGSFLLEIVNAWNMNDSDRNSGVGTFVSSSLSPAYFSEVSGAPSLGVYSRFDFDLTRRWTLFYKLDALALERQYLADMFYRHGIGVKFVASSHFNISGRYEKAVTRRPGIEETGVMASQDALFFLGHLWF